MSNEIAFAIVPEAIRSSSKSFLHVNETYKTPDLSLVSRYLFICSV